MFTQRIRWALAATLLVVGSGLASAQVEKPAIRFSQGWLFQATQVQFPLAYVLSKHTDLHEQGIWWALPVSNIVTALITLCLYAKGDWKKKRLIEPEEELAGKVTEDILVGEVSR